MQVLIAAAAAAAAAVASDSLPFAIALIAACTRNRTQSIIGPLVYISSLGLFVNDDLTLMKWLVEYCGFSSGMVKKGSKKSQ